ncbi:Pre-mRNA-splicing factor cef1, partial [Coemansia sp. 'formosensis']
MRIHLKGGVWKNTEDEILKAAVMKYGKTQWARISSLLVRKTPKQCKARWYEWLDPSIKKTEWSKDEDEKLLHLAKLMPTQWRTIAPIVGRAPAQCLERYQRLLDEAEARATGEDDGLGLQGADGQAEARRLRPGEIDPNPESKAARPDPVDMDEDEKDMLSEARARLANTQGKKAKRKARERQLEEARRLATLQKRRELKAAGVDLKIKKKKKDKLHLDYNAEIPYEKRPMPGFYDTTTELAQADKGAESLRGRFLDSLEAKSRVEREADERKEAKRKRDNKDKGVSFVRASDQKTIDAFAEKEEVDQLSKRSRLVLPAPQVNDGELETIAKLGHQSIMARDLVAGGSTDTLLGDYADTSVAARTPRTPAQPNRVMNEALAQRALAAQPTPLSGAEASVQAIPRSEGTGYDGLLPRGIDAATPNPLALSLRPNAGSEAAAASTARDELGLNTPSHSVGTTAREQKMAGRSLREQLALKLAKLPAPKNELEIVVPEVAPEPEDLEKTAAQIVEDQADVERRMEKMRIEEAELEMRRRTKCVQLDLPRPSAIPTSTLAVAADPSIPEAVLSLIGNEMRALMLSDARKYP